MMIPAALLQRIPDTAGKIGRVFAALAVIASAAGLAVAQTPTVATGKYSGGECRLRLESATQQSADRKRATVALEFRLEFPEGGAGHFTAQLPAGFFLNNDRSPLLAATVGTSKNNVATDPHAGVAEGKDSLVTIRDLEVAAPLNQLKNVDLELVLVKITDWDEVKFSGIELGETDYLPCGPFEYRVNGTPDYLRVTGWAFPKFRAEQEAYRKRMPLRFLNHLYALEEVKLVDAAGHSPTGKSLSTSGSGSSFGVYSSWSAPASDAASAAPNTSASDQIAYPVTLMVRLPKKFATERVRFHFNDVPVSGGPAPAPVPAPAPNPARKR